MKGWLELLLCGVVLGACWTRTPVGPLLGNAAAWLAGGETTDVLASFRTELPPSLSQAIVRAIEAPVVDLTDGEGPWTTALQAAIAANLGAEAQAALVAQPLADPAVALEEWAIGIDQRDRAVARARAAGEADAHTYAVHRRYLPATEAAKADRAVKDTMALATALDLAWPVDPATRVSSPFGYRTHPTLGTRKLHEGVDIPLPVGTPVHAAGAARVQRAKHDKINGHYVKLDHGHGVTTAYCHGDEIHVNKADQVAAGDHVMDSGNTGRSTGPHLHFGLRIQGRAVDPAPFRKRAANPASVLPPAHSAAPAPATGG